MTLNFEHCKHLFQTLCSEFGLPVPDIKQALPTDKCDFTSPTVVRLNVEAASKDGLIDAHYYVAHNWGHWLCNLHEAADTLEQSIPDEWQHLDLVHLVTDAIARLVCCQGKGLFHRTPSTPKSMLEKDTCVICGEKVCEHLVLTRLLPPVFTSAVGGYTIRDDEAVSPPWESLYRQLDKEFLKLALEVSSSKHPERDWLAEKPWVDRLDDTYKASEPTWQQAGYTTPGWYWWDETHAYCTGPFPTQELATQAKKAYFQLL